VELAEAQRARLTLAKTTDPKAPRLAQTQTGL